ncbi:MAG: hypothetical protein AAFV53_25800 [Myxococcota bacterium]
MASGIVKWVAAVEGVEPLWRGVEAWAAAEGDRVTESRREARPERSVDYASGSAVILHSASDGAISGFAHVRRPGVDSVLSAALGLLRAVAPHVQLAEIENLWGGQRHLASVPLMGGRHAAYARQDWINRWYPQSVTWPDGVHAERVAGGVLVTRLLDVVEPQAFEAAALIHNQALWFQACPGLTRPPRPPRKPSPPTPPGRLDVVGVDASTGEVEYATVVGADGRIAWWELAMLAEQVSMKRLSDGRPIRGVRVGFSKLAGAFANLVPLLDCGVRVLSHDEDGDEVELSWD